MTASSQTVAQRQAKYRDSLRHRDLERITLVVSAAIAKLLRDLSRDQNEPLARVLEMGALVAQRQLTALASQE